MLWKLIFITGGVLLIYLILKSLMFLLCTLLCYIFCFGRWGGTLRSSRQWENPCLVFDCRRVYQIVSAGGISFPNSLHSHHSDFAEANPSDTDSRYHSPSPKIEYYGLSMSLVFFSALVCGKPPPLKSRPQVLLRIFHVWGCESVALTPPRKGANGRRAVPMGCIRCILSTCVLQHVLPKCDVAADSGCCLSFQKVSSPSGSKNDLPVNPPSFFRQFDESF